MSPLISSLSQWGAAKIGVVQYAWRLEIGEVFSSRGLLRNQKTQTFLLFLFYIIIIIIFGNKIWVWLLWWVSKTVKIERFEGRFCKERKINEH